MSEKLNAWGVLGVVAVTLAGGLVALDVMVDTDSAPTGELVLDFAEKVILVGAMMVAARIVFRLTSVEEDTRAMRADLSRARDEGEAWRRQSRQLMTGLALAIQRQFDEWGLTPAESDIAGLMLKGLSLKDIAGLRRTSEATIRQQAQGIYRKSGLSNRAELSAYFLEDLYDVATNSSAPGDLHAGPHPLN